MDKIAVTIIAIQSDSGADQSIGSTPFDISGRTIMNGTKHKMSRTIEAITALIGLPTAWKKIEFTLIMQLIQMSDINIFMVIIPNSQ